MSRAGPPNAAERGGDAVELLRAYRRRKRPPWIWRTRLRFAVPYVTLLCVPMLAVAGMSRLGVLRLSPWVALAIPQAMIIFVVVPTTLVHYRYLVRRARAVAERGGLVCPQCFYSLPAEPPIARCPECGEVYAAADLPGLWARGFGAYVWKKAVGSAVRAGPEVEAPPPRAG